MMKYLVAALFLAQAAAFTTVAPSARASTHLAAEYEKKEGEGKINLMVIELSRCSCPYVHVHNLTNGILLLLLLFRLTWIAPRLPPWMRLKRARKSTADAGCRVSDAGRSVGWRTTTTTTTPESTCAFCMLLTLYANDNTHEHRHFPHV